MLPMFVSGEVQFSDAKIIASVRGDTPRVADLDGDGDTDFLLFANGAIVWYANDGKGNWGSRRHIASMSSAESLFAEDLDGDQNLDILFATTSSNRIGWFRNTDGEGNFGSQILISDQLGYANGVHAADLDGDGDLDALSASAWDNKIAWYENVDGNGSFGDQNIISTLEEQPYEVYADDIDLDGDMDVLSAVRHFNNIVLYENTDGLGHFEQKQIVTQNQEYTLQLQMVDLNEDAWPDILAISGFNDIIAWYPNLKNGAFGSQHIIKSESPDWDHADSVTGAFAVDLDGDGDLDILGASEKVDKIFWFERLDEDVIFSDEQIIVTTDQSHKNRQIVSADVDGDGDLDILSSSLNCIEWYENLSNTSSVHSNDGIQPKNFKLFQNYPNPFNPSTMISYQLSINSKVTLEIYNTIGQKVATLVNGWQNAGKHQIQWHVYGLPSGIYLARLQTEFQIKTMKLVLQK